MKETDVLNRLLQVSEDARHFYRSAAGKVSDRRLGDMFQAFARIRSNISVDLTRIIRDHGGRPAADGTLFGKMKQFFGEIAAQRSDKPEEALVRHLQETEDRGIESFEEALQEDLPTGTKRLLSSHLEILRETHGRMEALLTRYI